MSAARAEYDAQLNGYQREVGEAGTTRLYWCLALLIKWLRSDGHGKCELNAKDHVLGDKVKTETYRPVLGDKVKTHGKAKAETNQSAKED